MRDLTELEWKILDSLAVGWASTAVMEVPGISLSELRDSVYSLYKRGLLYNDSGTVDYVKLMNEPPVQTDPESEYSFGLTELGSDYWTEGSKEYSDEPVDWSNASISVLLPREGWGYVEGTTKEVCLATIEEIKTRTPDKIMENSLSHEEIEGFKPAYHKYITGGHRIKFKIKKKN